MSWRSLPDEMVREILGKLSLIELAPITTTCSSFRAFYREKMAREQEARHQLAINCFGSERIACLCALIVRLLKRGVPLCPQFLQDGCVISAEGSLHGPSFLPHPATPEDICVNIRPHFRQFWSNVVEVLASDAGAYWLTLHIQYQLKRAVIEVRDDESLKPVALMQALLSQGLARSILDFGFQAQIRVGRSGVQIGPLMPFASRYIPAKTTRWEYVREGMLIGVAAEYWFDFLLY